MTTPEEPVADTLHTIDPEQLPVRVRCIENIWIPMADGASLAARLWLPEDAEQRPVPALIEYIPYRKRDLTRARDEINQPYLAGHGYACLRIDLRGSGDSDGVLRDQYLEQELSDGETCVAWAAAQPWCNGKVGMSGISWGGFNALQIAARRPPALKAIIAACATDDLYADNMHYMGGCLLADNLSEATTMFGHTSCPPDPEIVGDRWRQMWLDRLAESGLWLDIWLRHQHRDSFWTRASVCEDYAAINCPVMAVSGWADGYTNAVFRLLEHLKVPRQGLIGPWGHKFPHQGIPGPAIGFLQEVVRWFDHWLKDIDNGIEDEPMLRAWMQDSIPPSTRYQHRPGRWVAEQSWPSTRVKQLPLTMTRYHLLFPGEKRGNAQATTDCIQSPLTLGLFAGKWCSYPAAPDLPHDQRQEDGGALLYTSAPLAEPLEILGAAEVELSISVNRPVAQVCVRLEDVLPDGKATRVTYGLLNLTHRHGSESPKPVQPGKRYLVRVPMNHVAQSFARGHRIRLAISSSYWPLAWPSPEPVELSLAPLESRLLLPCRTPAAEDSTLRPLGPPEGAPPLQHTLIEPEHHNWLVHRNLELDSSELEVIRDSGTWLIDDIGLTVSARVDEWYRSRDDEFASVSGETRTFREFHRGDWRVTIRTRTRVTSSATDFYIVAEIDAWEGDKRIFCHNWDRKIPRDLL
ncbi:CocE/NonD family hydrolase [Marinobacter sp. HL-58]|uniref:CocE/NonD family hydrolase n=1 Tax=Marinobacter sp. HL-58 TaxID=1479237 RepID=UPI0006D985A9|nr:CocE/NonD family hydrolase [Marinobacter sp. HL-58]KPP98892.1 MAG: putative hydrolase, CocE/NonD family [Marinobacter sp. HL-58]